MQELTTLFEEATRLIPKSYFHVQIEDGDPIYRERVYCHELYHQLRFLWPTPTFTSTENWINQLTQS